MTNLDTVAATLESLCGRTELRTPLLQLASGDCLWVGHEHYYSTEDNTTELCLNLTDGIQHGTKVLLLQDSEFDSLTVGVIDQDTVDDFYIVDATYSDSPELMYSALEGSSDYKEIESILRSLGLEGLELTGSNNKVKATVKQPEVLKYLLGLSVR